MSITTQLRRPSANPGPLILVRLRSSASGGIAQLSCTAPVQQEIKGVRFGSGADTPEHLKEGIVPGGHMRDGRDRCA